MILSSAQRLKASKVDTDPNIQGKEYQQGSAQRLKASKVDTDN